jgi:hypothetical protein
MTTKPGEVYRVDLGACGMVWDFFWEKNAAHEKRMKRKFILDHGKRGKSPQGK